MSTWCQRAVLVGAVSDRNPAQGLAHPARFELATFGFVGLGRVRLSLCNDRKNHVPRVNHCSPFEPALGCCRLVEGNRLDFGCSGNRTPLTPSSVFVSEGEFRSEVAATKGNSDESVAASTSVESAVYRFGCSNVANAIRTAVAMLDASDPDGARRMLVELLLLVEPTDEK